MNYACDFDVFSGMGPRGDTRAVFEAQIERRYNVATIYKRALGQGTIQRVTGLAEFKARGGFGGRRRYLAAAGHVRAATGRATLVSDGFIMLRHADLATTIQLADAVGTDVQLYAG